MSDTQLPLPEGSLKDLQEMLLKAILSGQTLPGGKTPIMFPDISFILQQPAIILLNDNLLGSISTEESAKPVRILSREALKQEAQTQGDIAYLAFQPSEIKNDEVRLTLRAELAPGDPNKRSLGLGGVQVRFRRNEGQWEVVDEPTLFAS